MTLAHCEPSREQTAPFNVAAPFDALTTAVDVESVWKLAFGMVEPPTVNDQLG